MFICCPFPFWVGLFSFNVRFWNGLKKVILTMKIAMGNKTLECMKFSFTEAYVENMLKVT